MIRALIALPVLVVHYASDRLLDILVGPEDDEYVGWTIDADTALSEWNRQYGGSD